MCRLRWNARPRQLGDQHPLQPGKCGPYKEAEASQTGRDLNLYRPPLNTPHSTRTQGNKIHRERGRSPSNLQTSHPSALAGGAQRSNKLATQVAAAGTFNAKHMLIEVRGMRQGRRGGRARRARASIGRGGLVRGSVMKNNPMMFIE